MTLGILRSAAYTVCPVGFCEPTTLKDALTTFLKVKLCAGKKRRDCEILGYEECLTTQTGKHLFFLPTLMRKLIQSVWKKVFGEKCRTKIPPVAWPFFRLLFPLL